MLMCTYYERLGVSASASNEEITRAFRVLALSAHPDKGGSRSRWEAIQEAYETLCSPEKRCLYDIMGAFAQLAGDQWPHFDSDQRPCSPLQASRCGSGSSASTDYTSSEDTSMAAPALLGKRAAPSQRTPGQQHPSQQPCSGGSSSSSSVAADVLVQLRLTLEELFTGCTKQLRLKRRLFLPGTEVPCPAPGCKQEAAAGGRWAETEELFRIAVSPGAREGTRFSFAGKGNLLPGATSAGSMVIVLHQWPHHHYTRRGNHLHVTCAVPLLTCLSGGTACISTLDGRTLLVPLGPDCLQPAAERIIIGEGMPLPNAPHMAPMQGPAPAHKEPSEPTCTQQSQQPQKRRLLRAVRSGSMLGSGLVARATASDSRGDLHVHFQVVV